METHCPLMICCEYDEGIRDGVERQGYWKDPGLLTEAILPAVAQAGALHGRY
jgi:hypothetical protein